MTYVDIYQMIMKDCILHLPLAITYSFLKITLWHQKIRYCILHIEYWILHIAYCKLASRSIFFYRTYANLYAAFPFVCVKTWQPCYLLINHVLNMVQVGVNTINKFTSFDIICLQIWSTNLSLGNYIGFLQFSESKIY